MHNRASTPQGPSLFDTPDRTVLSVSTLTSGLRALVEEAYDDVWVEGELSNFKQHTSGHCYFTLKDADAQIRGVMWRHFTQYLPFHPRDGMLVHLHGQVSMYERRGDVQLLARSMRLAGEGALRKAFEALKQKLADEGLFDEVHKRPLPPYPETIGIVTSGTGAALHDVLSILARRFPHVRVLVCPVQVQGMGAGRAITEAIEAFNAVPPGDPLRAELLIVGRGGGSAEDLWAFNEEEVARAIFASTIPVISAVGHETDYAISDYVADVRAATPSMAAELAVPDRHEVAQFVRACCAGLTEDVLQRIREHRQQVRHLVSTHSFRRPVDRLQQAGQRLDELVLRLHRGVRRHVEAETRRCETLRHRLHLLDPQRPLARGYVWVERGTTAVRSADALHPGDRVTLRFRDGRQEAIITDPES